MAARQAALRGPPRSSRSRALRSAGAALAGSRHHLRPAHGDGGAVGEGAIGRPHEDRLCRPAAALDRALRSRHRHGAVPAAARGQCAASRPAADAAGPQGGRRGGPVLGRRGSPTCRARSRRCWSAGRPSRTGSMPRWRGTSSRRRGRAPHARRLALCHHQPSHAARGGRGARAPLAARRAPVPLGSGDQRPRTIPISDCWPWPTPSSSPATAPP